MSDSYIDPRETLIYGALAREQLDAVVLGLVPGLDAAVRFADVTQAKADAAMKEVLDRQPAPAAAGVTDDAPAPTPVDPQPVD